MTRYRFEDSSTPPEIVIPTAPLSPEDLRHLTIGRAAVVMGVSTEIPEFDLVPTHHREPLLFHHKKSLATHMAQELINRGYFQFKEIPASGHKPMQLVATAVVVSPDYTPQDTTASSAELTARAEKAEREAQILRKAMLEVTESVNSAMSELYMRG